MNRHEQREKAMIAVYQYLLVSRDIEELIADTFNTEENEPDEYFIRIVHQSVENKERYEQYINNVLKGWTFERLGCIEKAILLNGCSEFDLKQLQAAVIIDEYVTIAKEYCDEEAFKLINRVLDII